MIDLPDDPRGVPVLRTDFTDDAAWAQLRADLVADDYSSGYTPHLQFVERRDLSGIEGDLLESEIPRAYPSAYEHPFLVLVDAFAVSSPEHPVLLIDLSEDDTSTSFRALPREVSSIEANLSISNMDFFEFGESTDDDGVFRGFGS